MALPPSNPLYRPDLPTTFVADTQGWLFNPFSLEVEVLNDAGDVAFARTPVDVATDFGSGGDKLGTGYFRAAGYDPQDEDWGAGPDPGPGRRTLTWFCVPESGDAELSWKTYTERLEAGAKRDYGVPYYALVADLRDEGFTTAQLSDVAAARLLGLATQYVERFTGRRFVPEPRSYSVNGKGRTILQVAEPIVALETITADVAPFRPEDIPFTRDILRVYNRHLSQRLRIPDDRENPKVELYRFTSFQWGTGIAPYTFHRLFWPIGQQNVHLSGVFGYTEPDGSPMGCTPALVVQATMMIVLRLSGSIGSGDRFDTTSQGKIASERTRDQSVSRFGRGGAAPGDPILGAFTGDPEVDTLLAMFKRPPLAGAS
jgi:hypothetical protein